MVSLDKEEGRGYYAVPEQYLDDPEFEAFDGHVEAELWKSFEGHVCIR